MNIPKEFVNEIIQDIKNISGLILWHVTGTWANKGIVGEINEFVMAKTAIDAIIQVWEYENDCDLRMVNAKWLCPIESITRLKSLLENLNEH